MARIVITENEIKDIVMETVKSLTEQKKLNEWSTPKWLNNVKNKASRFGDQIGDKASRWGDKIRDKYNDLGYYFETDDEDEGGSQNSNDDVNSFANPNRGDYHSVVGTPINRDDYSDEVIEPFDDEDSLNNNDDNEEYDDNEGANDGLDSLFDTNDESDEDGNQPQTISFNADDDYTEPYEGYVDHSRQNRNNNYDDNPNMTNGVIDMQSDVRSKVSELVPEYIQALRGINELIPSLQMLGINTRQVKSNVAQLSRALMQVNDVGASFKPTPRPKNMDYNRVMR